MSKDKKPEKRVRKAITFRRKFSTANPPSSAELRDVEEFLAKLVARAYAADHPELFKKPGDEGQRELNGDE